jgi:Zn-dependent protease with chaperone function
VAVVARPRLRVTAEVAFLALLAIAFPLLFGLAVVVAGGLLILAVGHFAAFLLKLLWLLVFPLFAGLRGLWSSWHGAPGEPLIRSHAPELFATIDRLRAASKARRIHGVYLTDELNASMSQLPSHGIFGATRNELRLGLPLMVAMDEAHFTAVLAHEIGHLARRHGSFASRVYAMRQTLELIVTELAGRRSPLVYPVALFYRAVTPRFERATLELSRAVEFEADAAAAAAVGAEVAAEALVVLHGIDTYCSEHVWPAIFGRVRDEPEPPADVYAVLAEELRRPIADGHQFVASALERQTVATDTHPALRDRLGALGVDPARLEDALDRYAVPERSAADAFLSGAGAQRRAIANEWRSAMRAQWDEAHARRKLLLARLAELDALGGALDDAQRVERALVTAQLDLPGASALLVETSDAFPREAELALRAGAGLAQANDERAVTYLERAIAADPACAMLALGLARAMFARLHDAARESEYAARIASKNAEIEAASAERGTFTGAEPLEPHGLNEEELAQVRRALDLPGITAAYLARRRLTALADVPHFVLAVARTRAKNGASDDNIARIIADDLGSFPHGITVVVSSRPRNAVLDALRAVDGAQLSL